jgi:hypothetical protein
MICSVVAVGDSAKDWYKTPCDISIGVNDVLKHGHDVDQLLIINFPRKFTPDRMHNILTSKAKAVVIRLSPFAG